MRSLKLKTLSTCCVALGIVALAPAVLAQQPAAPVSAPNQPVVFNPDYVDSFCDGQVGGVRTVHIEVAEVNTGSLRFGTAAGDDRGAVGRVGVISRNFELPDLPAKKIKIGITVPAADHGWTAGVGWWAKRAMTLYPDIEFVYSTAPGPEKQIADVEDMMVKGIDGLVILCTESAPLTPIAKKAHEKGIFIVNVDRGFLPEAGQIADIFLEGDNKAFGRKSAQFIADKLGKKGNVVILTGIPCTVDTDRVNAGKEVFAACPDIKVLDTQAAMWNREKGLQVMENMLSKHKKIDAVWAQDDDILLGAMQAIKEAGREKEMWVFGGAGMKDVVQKVMAKDPMIPADITYPPSMIAAGIHEAVAALRDGNRDKVMEFMPRHLMMDVELITPDNAKRFYFPDSVY